MVLEAARQDFPQSVAHGRLFAKNLFNEQLPPEKILFMPQGVDDCFQQQVSWQSLDISQLIVYTIPLFNGRVTSLT